MAAKKSRSRVPRASAPRALRKARRSAPRKEGLMGKIKWGEAGLMALAGYFSGLALYKSGVAPYLYEKSPQFQEFVNATGAPNSGMATAKGLGVVVGAKALYDIFSGKNKDKALNMELPFAIGAILDPKSEYDSSKTTGGRW